MRRARSYQPSPLPGGPAMPHNGVMAAAPTEAPRPRRRWLQFSLRTLLVVMLVAALGMAWVARQRQLAWQRQQAIGAIE
jgi:hypothetical protein